MPMSGLNVPLSLKECSYLVNSLHIGKAIIKLKELLKLAHRTVLWL